MPENKVHNTAELYDTLNSMKLPLMAQELLSCQESGDLYSKTPLEIIDRMISVQRETQLTKGVGRLKTGAHFYWPQADLSSIIYEPERHLNIPLIDDLSTNDYIRNQRNLFIVSATGCGKTFFACAFGNQACESMFKVKYFQMSDLLIECAEADKRGEIKKYIDRIGNSNLIIIDDFLLTSISLKETEYLFKLLVSKPKNNKPRSFIICSQLMKDEMYTRMSDVSPSLADTIINRLAAKAITFEIQGPSMREIV